MAMYVFDCVYVWGAGHVCGVGRPYGQKVGNEGAVDRRADKHPQKITRECQMHNKEGKKTPSYLMRLLDLTFLHLPW